MELLRQHQDLLLTLSEQVTLLLAFSEGVFEKYEKKGRPGCIGCEEHRNDALNGARRRLCYHHGAMNPDPM
ncbi:MAG: hypothetical protein DIU71_17365 [Proteobacteria bacterium]|nr:MAG: hypothetical protein DIU71_17365 [Pseudomonadota bacterium]